MTEDPEVNIRINQYVSYSISANADDKLSG